MLSLYSMKITYTYREHKVAVDGLIVRTNIQFCFQSLRQFKSVSLKQYFQLQFIDFVSLVVPLLLVHLVHT